VFPTGKGKAELNKLRQIMAIEVVKKVRAHTDKHLFYLEAPTGGGKTNLSMLALAEFLDANPEINKVYYVFPFTTLVTQTHKALLQTTKLTNTQVAELHSRAGLLTKTGENEEEDGEYGNEKPDWLDHLFLHFPITVLTHVRFFHILCTHRKEANYLLHRLANSVVIVDEVQAYPPKHWDKLIYFIRNFAKHFNIRFLLMSATLPKLGNLKVIRERTDDIVYLLDKPKERFFLNDNFAGRVKFRFDLMNEALTLDRLTELVLEKSKDWAERNTNHPNSVFAIIEFIFKKTSKEFFDKIDKLHKGFFDEIFVLSGTILEPRRRQIINFLKHPNNRSKRVLLITTQVVEAGVDIDMDFGFKDSSIPDSDEQLAGRINRNVSKSTGDLYLFNLDSASMVYKNDPRLKAMKENKELKENHERMLNEKDFDLLYNKVLLGIDGINELDQIENLSTYRRRIRQADFREVEKHFRLIDQENYSVFVPIALPVCVAGEKEKEPWEDVFKKEEKEFLSKFDVSPRYSEERKEECYFGDEIWQVFEKLVKKDEDKSISAREIDLKQIQGIMSKFIFSILANDNSEKYLKQYIDPEKSKYGFFYLSNLAVYDYSSGLKSEKDAHFDLVFP
jgi:CRISPR-associated endonuclease/helicase Cas3